MAPSRIRMAPWRSCACAVRSDAGRGPGPASAGRETIVARDRRTRGGASDGARLDLDERGSIRRHINVYVNGERGAELTPVGPEDRIDVLPAISGGEQ